MSIIASGWRRFLVPTLLLLAALPAVAGEGVPAKPMALGFGGEQLATLANSVLGNYQGHGKILIGGGRADVLERPAEIGRHQGLAAVEVAAGRAPARAQRPTEAHGTLC